MYEAPSLMPSVLGAQIRTVSRVSALPTEVSVDQLQASLRCGTANKTLCIRYHSTTIVDKGREFQVSVSLITHWFSFSCDFQNTRCRSS